jgi:2-polyprenyl-3-methyl-5-hydroxy-6-metoxy-1,4-benzoquinol methylase
VRSRPPDPPRPRGIGQVTLVQGDVNTLDPAALLANDSFDLAFCRSASPPARCLSRSSPRSRRRRRSAAESVISPMSLCRTPGRMPIAGLVRLARVVYGRRNTMSVQTRPRQVYLMGYSETERRRLIEQAALFRPVTERFLVEAGICRGMRVLDVGCGVGDVSLLLSELVGPEGAVVGVDRDPHALELARQRAQRREQIAFLEGDIQELGFGADFDAVVGRWVLIHVGDPAAAIRHAAACVRPGGIVGFQDSDYSTLPPPTWPRLPLFETVATWLRASMQQVGVHERVGLSFRRLFAAAGLPTPTLKMEVLLGGGPDFAGYRYYAEAVRSMLPLMEQHEVVSAAEVDIDTLADRLRAEALAVDATITLPPIAAAWTRKAV